MAICRCCGVALPREDTLVYLNMPKGAQAFPNKDELVIEKGVDIRIKQCPWCGLVQAVGEPVSYYRDVIRATGVSEEMRAFRIKQFYDWVEEFRLIDKTVIEIGCGKGEYMSMMESAGSKVIGLEHMDENIEVAISSGHHVIKGFIEDENTTIEGYPYEGFYIMNFLEHIPNPGEFLRGIANNLTKDGVGLVEVPNFDMILKESMYSEFIQDHLSYFTAETLTNLLSTNGFEVISVESIWYDYILSAKIRRRPPYDASSFINKQEKLKARVQAFLQRESEQGHKIAVWGAGHQALANLSLLDMAEHIVYVIDSAEFKQNKFTPATHIPILSPDVLNEGRIDTVIVNAGGYSDEIIRIMAEKYEGIKAVKLEDV